MVKSLLQKEKILCIREIQRSIKESVHAVLVSNINALGLDKYFTVTENKISNIAGSEFIFAGLRMNIDSIKSIEGISKCWIEEVQNVSRKSLDVLRPTIIAKDSEIIITFNPERDEDPVWQDFIVNTSEYSFVQKVNYYNNPFFPKDLDKERLECLEKNKDDYDWIWLGELRKISDAQIFKNIFEVREFETPEKARFFHGADWGYANDPTALIRYYIHEGSLYIDQEVCELHVELDDLPRLFNRITTAVGEDVKVAMDNALEASGHFNVIRNVVASGGIDAYPQFLGYSYLSGLQQNGFIRAGVEGLAHDMTAKFIVLIRSSDTENNDDDKIDKINEFLNKFQIKELFNKAAALNGYFGGCLIFIYTGDDLLSALDEKSLKNSIKNFVLVEPINTYPGRYNSTNPLSPSYFIPETWFVLGQEVHASRLLYLAADEVSMLLKPTYNFYGIAPAQIATDSVSHFIKDREAVSRLLHKYSLLVFKTDMGSALYNGNPEELYSRVKVLADFRDNDSVIIIDKEDEDIITVTTSMAGITDVVRLSLELMPIMYRQPLTKFLGISPGGMNATGESDENIDFIFKVQSSNDESKEVNNNKIKADTYVQLVTAGVISPEEARKALAEDEKSGFNSIDIDAVPEVTETGNEDLFGGLSLDWDPYTYDEFDESKFNRKPNG